MLHALHVLGSRLRPSSLAEFESFVRAARYRIRPLGEPNPMGIFPSWLEPDA